MNWVAWQALIVFFAIFSSDVGLASADSKGAPEVAELAQMGVFERSLESGPVVFLVLITLVALSIISWALLFTKMIVLKKTHQASEVFVKSFWESRSLNDLNAKLADFAKSPAREVFRSGYAELVKSSQLRDQGGRTPMVLKTAMSNMTRTLIKTKDAEKAKLCTYLTFLATTASAAPFIGLFGTVWGIMNAFDTIAATGSSSLAAVAPGISEALIATAFGLAAAIPAAIGYNMANHRIRKQLGDLDGFNSDFLNIVERYLVVDKRAQNQASTFSELDSPRI